MRPPPLGLAALLLAVTLSGPALAQSARAKSCDVVVESQTGGVIEVMSGATLTTPPRISWRPTTSSRAAELWVSYKGGTLDALGEPSAVMIRFPVEENGRAENTTLNIKIPNGRNWRFAGQGLVKGAEDLAYVTFGDDLIYGRALLGAIADGQTLTISLERYDGVAGSATIGTANLRARDVLLAQAKRKFEAADPASCGGW
jgi:hypothetical protein